MEIQEAILIQNINDTHKIEKKNRTLNFKRENVSMNVTLASKIYYINQIFLIRIIEAKT